jgi:hypothetical protein
MPAAVSTVWRLPVAATGSLVDNSSGTATVSGVQVEPGAILANQGTARVGTSAGSAVMVVSGLMTGALVNLGGGGVLYIQISG